MFCIKCIQAITVKIIFGNGIIYYTTRYGDAMNLNKEKKLLTEWLTGRN